MRFRRQKPPAAALSRRQRPAPEPARTAPKFAYRARRTDEALNIGRHTPRDGLGDTPHRLRRFILQRFGLFVLLVALGVSAINILSLSTTVRVMPLTSGTSDTFLHDTATYEQAARQLLAESVWNRNKVTVNTTRLNQQLLAQFPELSAVSVTLPLLNQRPIVYLQVSEPALILATPGGSYVLNDTGKALLLTSQLPGAVKLNLPTVTDQSGLQVRLNRQALTTDNMDFIRTVIGQLSAKQLVPTSFTLPPAASQLDVRLSGQPYMIKFNLQSRDARQQVGTFLATRAKLQSQHITPAEYIDVRVDGRAYYK